MRFNNEKGSMTEQVFPNRLKDILKLRGLTHASLGALSGIPASSISHFIHGKRSPSMETLIKLAKTLSISTDWLLGLDDKQPEEGTVFIAGKHYLIIKNIMEGK